jgi:hypothetical protein
MKIALYYILIVIERIYLIPLAGVRPCTMIGVFKNQYEKERLWKRVYIGTFCYTLLVLAVWFLRWLF